MNYLSTCNLKCNLRIILSKLWSSHKWRSREEIEWTHPLKQRPPIGENFKPSGHMEHMHPYVQVGGGVMWSDNPKKAGIGAGSLRYPTSLIRPCYGSLDKE